MSTSGRRHENRWFSRLILEPATDAQPVASAREQAPTPADPPTTAVAVESADAEPSAFVAVTLTRSVEPTSSSPST
jgi:hypothetical protein